METLIISDTHIGSRYSQAYKLIELIRARKPKKIIFLGDLTDGIPLSKLSIKNREVVEYLLNYPGLIFIGGNHDLYLKQILGNKLLEFYEWEENKKKFLAIHGHQFDSKIPKRKLLIKATALTYRLGNKLRMSRLYDRLAYGAYGFVTEVRDGATNLAKKRGIDVIICGHTHLPENQIIDKVRYCNTGRWIGDSLNYLTLNHGKVTVNRHE